MNKINFVNNSEPALSAENLNKMQDNMEEEINNINDILDEDTTEETQVQIDNMIFKKRGRVVFVQGWIIVNGIEKTITAPYKPRNDMWIPVVGVNNTLQPTNLGFIMFSANSSEMTIKLDSASTYATTGFSYLI